MSLQTAKRLAELKEEHDAIDQDLSRKYEFFRSEIRGAIELEFSGYLESQGFTVQSNPGNISASYRGLVLVLQYCIDPVMGYFDNFEIVVNGKTYPVMVVAKIDGEKHSVPTSGTITVADMENLIEAMKSTRDNMRISKASFILSPAATRLAATDIPELLDIILK
ncbi:hypothetical protein CCL11_15165 [Pseudomonas syringae]|uniref:hypothetical protein n=1 Tax=Pseudomonas syringae TaxID=317 RepID=UPI000BB6120D|nr:hypothetical protein [Pseudomonas syringae]PBP42887.1 hypothetical protein CCL11_15165 [Pseudomonas syringae]